MNNTIKTILLFGVLTLLLVALGRMFGDLRGMWLMAIIGIIINIFVYFFSDKIAIRSAQAKPLNTAKYSAIEEIVKDLTGKADLPMPKLYLSPNPQPNAFATGRNPKNSAVVVTKGLINNLDRNELRGVLAHEISHIKNRDILISTVAAVLASIITTVANTLRWVSFFGGNSDDDRNPLADLAVIILAPIAAVIIQMAISRSREFKADKTGAKLAGDPNGLADALEKIERISQAGPSMVLNPAFENLYITNPFSGGTVMGVIQKLFSTHPPVSDRVEKLRNWDYKE